MGEDPNTQSLVSQMFKHTAGERGAALITVLLFVVLVFILITAMLTVTGNEIVIAGLQRDGVRATELAQTGIQEAITRVMAGRPYLPGFTSSFAPACPASPQCVTVTVVNQYNGTGAAYLELHADATVGRSTRRLSALVLAQAISYPPNVTFAASVTETGSATISCGDAYSQTFLQFKDYPSNACYPSQPKSLTYAGWRTSKVNPGAVAACYTHAGCVAANLGNDEITRWYPGTRETTNKTTTEGNDITNWAAGADTSSCPASPPTFGTVASVASPGDKFATGVNANKLVSAYPAEPLYGFDTDDPDGAGPLPPLAVSGSLPCGFPYKWIRQEVFDETGLSAGFWWFKTIVFEQWLDRYWYFDDAKLQFTKGTDLLNNPAYGAVPPFPDFTTFTNNYDCKISGGGVLNSLPTACTLPDGTPSTTDMGCQNPPMTCTPTKPKVIVLEGNWTVNGNLGGHGTLIVNGDLIVNGTFNYWGTIVVNGTLQAGTGNVNVTGGLVALDTLRLIGNITVAGGSTVGGTPPTGPANVIGKAWWER